MKKSNRMGEKIITNQGYEIEIISYENANNISIMFVQSGLVLKNIQYTQIKKKNINNPYHPTYRGVGYFGVGAHKMMINRKFTKSFSKWLGILERCYSQEYQSKKPTYKGVLVTSEWHNFQNFGDWFVKNYIEGFHLDKDIVCPDCRIYSSDTCSFVPNEINSAFKNTKSYRGLLPIGVVKRGKKFSSQLKGKELGVFNTIEEAFECHKINREIWIKQLADKWKEKITEKCYIAMYNYKVYIND